MKEIKVLVLGGGPGGYMAAIRAAQLGAKVSLIESDRLGGTCMNRGCIPTKALLRATSYLEEFQRAAAYGILVGQPSIDFRKMMSHKEQAVKTLVRGVERLLKQHRVDLIQGYGRLTSGREIEVEDARGKKRIFSGDRLILAMGSKAMEPPVAGLNTLGVMNSDQALEIDTPPERLLIIGGGYIGLEFAIIYARLGSKVTVVEMQPQILPAEDEEIATALKASLVARGIEIITGSRIQKIVNSGSGLNVFWASEPALPKIVDKVLVAAGRAPRLDETVLGSIGLSSSGRGIEVSERLETSIPNVYAIGDLIGGYLLAHAAYAEGAAAAENALGGSMVPDYAAIPRCVFTSPEMAAVGLTEKQAREVHPDLRIGRFHFKHNGKALIEDEQVGFVKVIAEPHHGEILGIHILGPHATELLAEAVAVMSLEGTIADLEAVIHAHPTLSEAVREAAMDASDRAVHVPPRRPPS